MKDLEDGFAEVEKRVKALAAENRDLKGRISELEQELAQARRESQNFEHFQGKKPHLREKLERVLKSLETLGTKE